MSDTKKIVIIGGGPQAHAMKVLLEAKRPGIEVEVRTVEDHLTARKSETKQIAICDEMILLDQASKVFQSMGRALRKDIEAEPDYRAMNAAARYQEPPRLRGAAQQKRQAKKSKNRRRK